MVGLPYWLESDTFADEEVWGKLADRKPDLEDRLQAAYCRLKARASQLRSDGYLSGQKALVECRGRRGVLDLLCTPVFGQPPLVHRKGDVCDCLDVEWRSDYEYRIHAFLKRNPSRSENDRSRAQRADLRDPRLKALVYARDGGCCRYCRSGPLSAKAVRSRDRRKVLTYDHVDPDGPAGPDGEGLVVACGACNEWKGHRTPEEADMPLLAVPSDVERAAWQARGLALYQRTDHRPITDESPTDHRSNGDPVTDPIGDRSPDRDGDPIDDPTGEPRPEQAEQHHDQPTHRSAGGAGTGRGPAVSDSASDPPRSQVRGQPPRTSSNPDVYHHRSRAGPSPPDFRWPPDYTRDRPSKGGPEP